MIDSMDLRDEQQSRSSLQPKRSISYELASFAIALDAGAEELEIHFSDGPISRSVAKGCILRALHRGYKIVERREHSTLLRRC